VIHLLEDENVHVAQVAGNQIGHDIPAAVWDDLVAAGEPLQHQVDVIGSLALSDYIRRGTHTAAVADSIGQNTSVLAGEGDEIPKLPGKWIGQGASPHKNNPRFSMPGCFVLTICIKRTLLDGPK
jgi:hypothetical protein